MRLPKQSLPFARTSNTDKMKLVVAKPLTASMPKSEDRSPNLYIHFIMQDSTIADI